MTRYAWAGGRMGGVTNIDEWNDKPKEHGYSIYADAKAFLSTIKGEI